MRTRNGDSMDFSTKPCSRGHWPLSYISKSLLRLAVYSKSQIGKLFPVKCHSWLQWTLHVHVKYLSRFLGRSEITLPRIKYCERGVYLRTLKHCNESRPLMCSGFAMMQCLIQPALPHTLNVCMMQVLGVDPGFLEGGFRCEEEGVHFAHFISFFLNIPWKWNNLVSLRPNYFIFMGYLRTGGGSGGSSEPPEPPLDPPLSIVIILFQKANNKCVDQTVEHCRSAS